MNSLEPLKIMVITGIGLGNGTFHYRVNAPMAEAVWQGLAAVDVVNEPTLAAVAACDVVMLPALGMGRAVELREKLGSHCPLVVVESDDTCLALRADNPVLHLGSITYEEFIATHVPRYRAGLRTADLVTVTVPHLAAIYRRETTAPVEVLPNTIDEVLLEIPQRQRVPGQPLRLGWAGSGSHAADWAAHGPAVARGVREVGAKLILMGSNFNELIGVPDVEIVPWAKSMDEYYLPLSTWHAMLAPLVDDEFNRAKSPLKALEAGALGMPIVASAAGPYLEYVRDGETGFLCRTDSDWTRALRALANDEALRVEMGQAGRRQAADFTTQLWAPRWIDAYRTAIQRRERRLIGEVLCP